MASSKRVGNTVKVAAGALLAALGGTACTPDHVQIDPEISRPLSSALSLDPRIGAHRAPMDLAPITGGTLLVTQGDVAIVSDPDRDRIVAVDLVVRRVRGTIEVPGGQPGRIAEDAEGRVHVVLRGSGEIVSFHPDDLGSAERHAVCQSPRGIAFDAEASALQVACRDGFVVTMSTAGEVMQRLQLDTDDLRDIAATPSGLVVSRFRAAELVGLDRSGTRNQTARPISQVEGTDVNGNPIEFQPNVAWRMAIRGNILAVAHQRATDREIELSQPDAYGGGGGGGGGFVGEGDFAGTPRFAGAGCGGIVRSTVSFFDAETLSPLTTQGIGMATLPVDVAIAPDGDRFAVVAAGEQGIQQSVFEGSRSFPGDPCFGGFGGSAIPGPVAVAYTSRSELLVQQRDPAVLFVAGQPIALGGEERFDAGHAIFHGNAGLGLACASCHPEGGDDGHVWSFAGFGSLRTPALHGGIIETAPFHWNGDLPSVGALMNEVFERRMGGPSMDAREEASLSRWVDQLPTSHGREGIDMASADRGARLFWGEARCGDCHVGAQYTNNETIDVGTGAAFQVPSLIGVSFRLPVMHDGCATTLRARFEPSCGGGELHGHTSHLSEAQIGDLVAYLETM